MCNQNTRSAERVFLRKKRNRQKKRTDRLIPRLSRDKSGFIYPERNHCIRNQKSVEGRLTH